MKIINTYEIKDNFKDISIVVNTAHVEIKESENSDIKVVCHERKKHAHNVRVEDSTLIISKKKRKWYSYLLPSFDKANITIYIPINKIENGDYTKSSNENIMKFRDYLNEHGIVATIRRELGSDIDAACGQLRRKNLKT